MRSSSFGRQQACAPARERWAPSRRGSRARGIDAVYLQRTDRVALVLFAWMAACDLPATGRAPGDEHVQPAESGEAVAAAGDAPSGAHAAGVEDLRTAETPQPTPEQAACVAALAEAAPAALRDLLSDLGYRDALADACASQRAVREGDVAGCDALTATALRAGCRRRLVVRHGRPDDCPRWLDRGRDPTCLAWAARAPARCAAVPGTDALVCRAPFEGNPELCRELGVEQAACEADAARVAPLLEPREPRALPSVSGRLVGHFVADGPRSPTAPAELTVELDLTHGLYLERRDGAATLQLAPARRTLAHREKLQLSPFLVQLGALGDEPLRDVVVPAEALQVGLLPLVGGPPVRAPAEAPRTRDRETPEVPVDPPPSGSVSVLRLDPRRGGEVALEVDVQVPAAGGTYRLSGTLHTFVRDVDPLP